MERPPHPSTCAHHLAQTDVKRYETLSIVAAAAIEVGTGLVLVSFPSLFVRLLLGVDLSEPGQIVGRLTGFALIALVLACWPDAGTQSKAASSLRALLVFSVLVALYLVYLGIGSGFVGVLLWPAAVLHSAVAIFLAVTWVNNSRSGGTTEFR
jgi:hypothetical protein